MSLDQGKTSNMNGLGLLAQMLHKPIDEVGTTRYRPPYHPISLGVIAAGGTGRSYRPLRRLPAHRIHRELGACFEDHGGWARPAYYPRTGEPESDSIFREVRSVRTGVGVLDYSSLGKLEVSGRDARAFLDRVYINNIAGLQPGAARYGIMLREDGIVFDDGIIVCRSDDDFLLHTTSAGASGVYAHLDEWLQCEWQDLDVRISDTSTAWATFMLAGPKARQLMVALDIGIDFDDALFPHMQWCEVRLSQFTVRILRASFTGELSYEISVPAPYGEALLEQIASKGEVLGLMPFGVEALMVLRAEKGYLHLGVDTDGTTMPQDLGWGAAVKRKDRDFIGRRSLVMAVGACPGRYEFTGLLPLGGTGLRPGAHVIDIESRETTGYVTSACFSPTLDRPIALGLVASARNREGEVVTVFDNGERSQARLCSPCFVDPEGVKIHA
jgi:sarcosine oxidase subunit alpha